MLLDMRQAAMHVCLSMEKNQATTYFSRQPARRITRIKYSLKD